MLHFEKPQTEATAVQEQSRRFKIRLGAFLFAGMIAAASNSLAAAEELLDRRSVSQNIDADYVGGLIDPAQQGSQRDSALTVTAGRDGAEGIDFNASPTDAEYENFYTQDATPPASTSRPPSRMDEFNRGLSQIITVELDAYLDDRPVGQLIVETTLTSVIAVDSVQLHSALEAFVAEETLESLLGFTPGFVSVDQLQSIGITVRLNSTNLTLDVDAPLKPNGPLSFSLSEREAPAGTVTARPARVAAGLTSTFLVNQSIGNDDNTSVASALSGFVNIGGVRGLNLDYGGNLTIDDGNGDSRYEADRTILFVDRPERAMRFEAGTLLSPLSGLAGESDFLGIGITKSYRDLQPTRVLRPLGQRSFQLDRASEVTVLVDGQAISRFDAPAGTIDLKDIPLANVSNRVSILVEDEFGRRELENFSIASDAFLLEPGLTEYSFGIGQERDRGEAGFSYGDTTVATGNLQVGISSNFTTGGFGFLSEDLAVIGSESVFGILNGIARVELGYSNSDNSGDGMAASVNYRWASSPAQGLSQNFAIAFDYRDEAFTSAGSQFAATTKFEASAFYERQVTRDLRLNVSGAYTEDHLSGATSENLSLGASYLFGQFQLGAGVRFGAISGQDEEVGGFFTLTRRLGRRSSLNARHDTLNNRSSLSYRRPSRNKVGSVGLESELLNRDDDLSLRGSVDYTANRYRARLGVTQVGQDQQLDGDTLLSARLQTGIAFADGKLGVGRDPGRGFVMIGRHKSLSDARVEINSRGRSGLRASTDVLGPAIARMNSPFVPVTTRINVTNAPLGYNIGEGAYYSIPGARSAIRVTVGSDAFRSVVATFTVEGEPYALAAGTLLNQTTGSTQITFTNSAGRALLSDLEPGNYKLMFTGTDYEFEFEIDGNSETFSNLGLVDLSTEETQ